MVVFTPLILVCPSKAGLYSEFALFVSTGGSVLVSEAVADTCAELSAEFLSELLLLQAENIAAVQITAMVMYSFIDIKNNLIDVLQK